jgi:calcineurin-like phosphoesterase family protein
MANKFFTSDLHFGHERVIGYCNRPFQSARQMDEALIYNWNLHVKPDDIIYVIGDVFFCNQEEAKTILNRLNGKKRLVYGNHDKVIRNQKPIQYLFEEILPELYTEHIDGVMVHMCHYPMHSWNKAFHGAYMLHGHVHSPQPTDGKVRRYDVGVDANSYAPVRWETIKKTLDSIPAGEPDNIRSNRKTENEKK